MTSPCRCLLLLAAALSRCDALAVSASPPSFDQFLTSSLGGWKGASYIWQLAEANVDGKEMLPLGVAPGFVSQPTSSSTQITEVMRSCGGAVQGVEEARECQPAAGTVMLNRQSDGTTFFSYGSYAVAPPLLSRATDEERDFLASEECFGITVTLAHADATRRRLLVVVAGEGIACCDVAVEAKATTHPEAPALEVSPDGIGPLRSLPACDFSYFASADATILLCSFAARTGDRQSARQAAAVRSGGAGVGGRRRLAHPHRLTGTPAGSRTHAVATLPALPSVHRRISL